MKRESFKSRLGFLLVSAGCAIGIGNVWRFPYVAGQNDMIPSSRTQKYKNLLGGILCPEKVKLMQ